MSKKNISRVKLPANTTQIQALFSRVHFGPVHFVTDLTYFIISNQKKRKTILNNFSSSISKKKFSDKNIFFSFQSLVKAKTYIKSAQKFGRNTSLLKELHKKTLYQKIFHIETPWNPSGCNYCYFRGINISPLVLLLPVPARWRWTRIGRVSNYCIILSEVILLPPI